MKTLLFAILTFSSVAAYSYLNGSAVVNSCSGALFTMQGLKDNQKALVITNGHCIRLKNIRSGATSDYPAPYENIYNYTSDLLTENTRIQLRSQDSSIDVKAEKLIFATMTKTDVAIFQLQQTYAELFAEHKISPLILSPVENTIGLNVELHAAYFNKNQNCHIESRVNLKEGPYHTVKALKLSSECSIYNGFSGSPILLVGTRAFIGLANTHFEGDSVACSLGNPCEYDPFSLQFQLPAIGTSYGISTDFVFKCLDTDKQLMIQSCY